MSVPRRVQRTTERCKCGRTATVIRQTAYEFWWRCSGCGWSEWISWAHANEPPVWEGGAPRGRTEPLGPTTRSD